MMSFWCGLVGGGGVQGLQEFHSNLNSLDAEMKFTLVWWREQIKLLDTRVFHVNNTLNTRLFRKDMDRNTLLKFDSCHQRRMVHSLPYSQMLRAKRVVNDESDLDLTLLRMAEDFRERGYPQHLININKENVYGSDRKTL